MNSKIAKWKSTRVTLARFLYKVEDHYIHKMNLGGRVDREEVHLYETIQFKANKLQIQLLQQGAERRRSDGCEEEDALERKEIDSGLRG